MFATLVINLPSEHEGGELIVSHSGHHQHYSFIIHLRIRIYSIASFWPFMQMVITKLNRSRTVQDKSLKSFCIGIFMTY